MKYKCGRCGSRGLYLDKNIVMGISYIACLMCGEQYPGGKKPIKIKEEGVMLIKMGICSNCEGERKVGVKGLCGGCRSAMERAEPGHEAEALAAFKKWILATDVPPEEKCNPVVANKGTVEPTNYPKQVILNFTEGDRELWEDLEVLAKRERRPKIDEQILFVLQRVIEQSKDYLYPSKAKQ